MTIGTTELHDKKRPASLSRMAGLSFRQLPFELSLPFIAGKGQRAFGGATRQSGALSGQGAHAPVRHPKAFGQLPNSSIAAQSDGNIVLRQNADQSSQFIGDQEPPDSARPHGFHRKIKFGRFMHADRIAGHGFGNRLRRNIDAYATYGEVAVRDNTYRTAALDDRQNADLGFTHRYGRFLDRGVGLDRDKGLGHDLAQLHRFTSLRFGVPPVVARATSTSRLQPQDGV